MDKYVTTANATPNGWYMDYSPRFQGYPDTYIIKNKALPSFRISSYDSREFEKYRDNIQELPDPLKTYKVRNKIIKLEGVTNLKLHWADQFERTFPFNPSSPLKIDMGGNEEDAIEFPPPDATELLQRQQQFPPAAATELLQRQQQFAPAAATELLQRQQQFPQQQFPPAAAVAALHATKQANAAPVRWVPDNETQECGICKKQFGVFRRKHHCRQCGQIFCADCMNENKICNTCLKNPLQLPRKYTYN
jgi:hypothetical protein